MKMTATEFKAKCLKLIDRVGESGEPIVISKHGRPVARLIPEGDGKPWLKLRGRGTFSGDPFAPVVAEEEIEALD
jgi:prevent-host-death family protein